MGIEFDYVGGDGLYGNDLAFTRSVEDMGLVYMLDIHSDQKIHLEKPELHIPERKSNRGRPPKRPKASTPSVNANEYIETLTNKDWKSLTFVILPRES
uniref:transposase n=1 Tax=Saccharicrinis fermentans TaxID=982 RepID=UPI001FD4BEEE|nr:transposase [Saccharicrinis fermentans]